MKKTKLHPLDYYLLDKNQSLHMFSVQHKIPLRTLYKHLNGDVPTASLSTLQAIEAATKKAVTVQMQADWLKACRNG